MERRERAGAPRSPGTESEAVERCLACEAEAVVNSGNQLT